MGSSPPNGGRGSSPHSAAGRAPVACSTQHHPEVSPTHGRGRPLRLDTRGEVDTCSGGCRANQPITAHPGNGDDHSGPRGGHPGRIPDRGPAASTGRTGSCPHQIAFPGSDSRAADSCRPGPAPSTEIESFRSWALNSANWNSSTPSGEPGIDADATYGAQCADLGIAWSAWVGRRVPFDGWDTREFDKPGWKPIVGTLASARPGDVVTRWGVPSTSWWSSAFLAVTKSLCSSRIRTPRPWRPTPQRRRG